MAHWGLSLIGQAPGCSNCGNHIPLASPWHLAPFHGIKIFPGAATMGITFPRLPLVPGVILRHQNIPRMRCSCGKYFPCLLQVSVGAPPPGKKIPPHCGASSTYIRHIHIPFNKYLFGYKSRGGFFKKKNGKKRKKYLKESCFFWWDCLQAPRRPPQHKADSTRLDLWSGSPFFAGQMTDWMHRDLPLLGVGKNRAQRIRYSIFLEIALMVGS